MRMELAMCCPTKRAPRCKALAIPVALQVQDVRHPLAARRGTRAPSCLFSLHDAPQKGEGSSVGCRRTIQPEER